MSRIDKVAEMMQQLELREQASVTAGQDQQDKISNFKWWFHNIQSKEALKNWSKATQNQEGIIRRVGQVYITIEPNTREE